MFGGITRPALTPRNDVWLSSNAGATWGAAPITAAAPWAARFAFATAYFANKLWLHGGKDVSPGLVYADVWNSADGGKLLPAAQLMSHFTL